MARAQALIPPAASPRPPRPENFPVASWLLAPAIRPRVLAFYRFARAADDIADAPGVSREAKLAALATFADGLRGEGAAPARALAAALAGAPHLLAHAEHLLEAFRRDATGMHCRDWDDLMGYCACSAAPVGRFLLDLHGQEPALHGPADALCAALQVLNHLQDCGDDFTRLGRIYLPADWLAAARLGPDALAAPACAPGLRRVLERMLDGVDDLLEQAAPLAGAITDRRLAMETATIAAVATRLAAALRRADPLAGRVGLSFRAKLGAMATGLVHGLMSRQ